MLPATETPLQCQNDDVGTGALEQWAEASDVSLQKTAIHHPTPSTASHSDLTLMADATSAPLEGEESKQQLQGLVSPSTAAVLAQVKSLEVEALSLIKGCPSMLEQLGVSAGECSGQLASTHCCVTECSSPEVYDSPLELQVTDLASQLHEIQVQS